MTADQLRAARALLAWSQERLAIEAKIGSVTVRRAEHGEEMSGRVEAALRRTLEAAGVVLIEPNGGGPGVRLRRA